MHSFQWNTLISQYLKQLNRKVSLRTFALFWSDSRKVTIFQIDVVFSAVELGHWHFSTITIDIDVLHRFFRKTVDGESSAWTVTWINANTFKMDIKEVFEQTN